MSTEPLKGSGGGKTLGWKEKKNFKSFAFPRKTFAFPRKDIIVPLL